jgi:hypothetical protein
MSFREISAWVMGALMVVAGLYYVDLYIDASRALGAVPPARGVFIPYTAFVVTAVIVVQIVLASVSPDDTEVPPDERERPLLDRAGNWSGLVLGGLAVCALLHFMHYGDGNALFHLIVGSLIVSQIAEYGLQLILLRRGV